MLNLLLLLSTFYLAHSSCPSGFNLVRDGECRGLYVTVTINDNDGTDVAVARCKEIDAQPIIIHNEEHQTYWKTRAAATPYTYFSLGIICNTSSKQWQWSDGSSIDYRLPDYFNDLNGSCKTDCAWYGYTNGWWKLYCNKSANNSKNIFCTKQIKQPVPSDDGCDSFEDDAEDGVCYQVGVAAENWKDAQTICGSFGANLASIHNQKENSFIRRLAVSRGEVTGLYIGAIISGKDNSYAWIDGSTWDYENYYPGFPMDGFGDCLMMDTESTAGQWANVDCSTKLSVACMRQQNYTAPTCTAGPWQEGQIMFSPGFPFDASTPCDFILEVDTGKKVEVEILILEANSCCDQLVLFENYFGGTVVANLTGEVNDKKFVTSSSNFMRVSWRPNGGVNVRGMMMTYRGV